MNLRFKYIFTVVFGLLLSFFSPGYATDFSENEWIASEVLVSKADTTVRFIYYYNRAGQMVLATKYEKSVTGMYFPVNQTEWIYEQSLLTDEIYREFVDKNATMKHYLKYTYLDQLPDLIETFDSSNKLISSIDYKYENNKLHQVVEKALNEQAVMEINKITNIVSTDSLITETESIYAANEIVNSSQIVKELDTQKRLSKISYLISADNSFVNKEQYIYSYKSQIDSSIESVRKLFWKSTLSQWENSHKTTYLYSNTGKIKSETSQIWQSRFWKDDFRNFYAYDIKDNLIAKTKQIPMYQKWRNLNTVFYRLDDESLTAESEFEFWGGENGDALVTDIPVGFKNLNILVRADKVEVNLLNTSSQEIRSSWLDTYFYPNPSNGLMYLNTVQNSICEVRIYSLDGSLLLHQNIPANSGVLDASELPEGNYLLQLKSNQINTNQKITIHK